jgi:hypothetical protein
MKKIILCVLILGLSLSLEAQNNRNGISYQALITSPINDNGISISFPGVDQSKAPYRNKDVCIKFSFIDSNGNTEYSETQEVTTDVYGMVNLIIGTGNPRDGYSWDNIQWTADSKSLKVDVDYGTENFLTCGNFVNLSVQELTSVPFALYSPGSNVPGPKGDPGEEGMSAYEVWLDLGNTGTEQDFIDSLKGPEGDPGDPGDPGADGDSAYDIWIAAGNTGTEQEFLDSLKAIDGNDADSAYDIWIAAGNTGTEQEFLDSLKGAVGDPGDPGDPGTDGDSAYDLWIAEGNTGTLQQFLDSLKGADGDPGLLPDGSSNGNTTYWNGSEWVTDNNNLYNDGTNVMVGTDSVDPSSAFTVASSTKGVLLPKLSQSDRDLISNPSSGLLIFQTDNTPGFYYFDGVEWVNLSTGNGSTISVNSQDINNTLLYTQGF